MTFNYKSDDRYLVLAQMKDENMQFSKLVQLCPKGAFKPKIFASKAKRAFFWGHPVCTCTKFPYSPVQIKKDLGLELALNWVSHHPSTSKH